MRHDAPVRERVLDSLERKKRVIKHNFSDRPERMAEEIEKIDEIIAKIKGR